MPFISHAFLILERDSDCRHGRELIDEICDQRATRMRTEFSVITARIVDDCSAGISNYIVRTARNRGLPSATR